MGIFFSKHYWIYEDYFIFKPEFNDELNIYQNMIMKCKRLIFSNYDDYKICIETNNKCKEKYNNNYKVSKFNKVLGDTFNHLINLRQLTFGCCFNQPLENSLDKLINLQQLTFHVYFNQPLANSLNKLINLQQLTFGYNFNQPLANSLIKLINLQQLTLGYEFKQKLEIPFNIRILNLECNNQYIINNLPDSIEELELGIWFNLKLDNLPSSMRIIRIKNVKYNWELNNLPKFLKKLILPKEYIKEIENINPQCLIEKIDFENIC